MPTSTVHRVLVRHDLNRLSHVDRQTGQPIRRCERQRPGELVHVDVKKLGKIPKGGGHKVRGRAGRALGLVCESCPRVPHVRLSWLFHGLLCEYAPCIAKRRLRQHRI